MKAADVVKKSVWAVQEAGKSQAMTRTLPYVADTHQVVVIDVCLPSKKSSLMK